MAKEWGSFDKQTQRLPIDAEQYPHGHPGPAQQQPHQGATFERLPGQRQGGIEQLGLPGVGMALYVDQGVLPGSECASDNASPVP